MNSHDFTLAGTQLSALGSGALWWPEQNLLCVSDLHLGKSERIARQGGAPLPPYDTRDTLNLRCVSDLHLGKSERIARQGGAPLPPYDTRDTLNRLAADLAQTRARTVICLGDSFDDLGAARALPESERLWIARLQAGRRWVWIEGNHDPGPIRLGGTHLAELPLAPLIFRHIARPGTSGEVSGHYHPKAQVSVRGRKISRPAFLIDSDRLILPSYGTYTGGLHSHDQTLSRLMRSEAIAILTGRHIHTIPMPRT